MVNNVLKHVDILDLVVVNIFKGLASKEDPYPLVISIDPLEADRRFVIDSDAQKVLNDKLSEKLKDADPRNPNVIQYAKEFIGKMISELHRSGLCFIEDMPEAKDDPYADAKKLFKSRV